MTKEITKSIILQEMQDKFKLREFEPSKFLFDEKVVPVYDIGEHIRFATSRFVEVSVTSGPTSYSIKIIPFNQRWCLRGYNVIFMAAGAYKVTGVYIQRKLEYNANSFIYLDMVEGQTASYAVNLPVPVVLEPGDLIAVYVDDYTSTAALRVYLDHTVEDIR